MDYFLQEIQYFTGMLAVTVLLHYLFMFNARFKIFKYRDEFDLWHAILDGLIWFRKKVLPANAPGWITATFDSLCIIVSPILTPLVILALIVMAITGIAHAVYEACTC